MKGGFFLLPQTHAIIAKVIYEDVFQEHQLKLNKNQLIYGSIKPDLYSGFPKLKHFKPQSFTTICQDIAALSSARAEDNQATISRLSQKIGIVTHYVADYFCVPHNDRETYHNHIISHIKYENKLHQMYKDTTLPRKKNLLHGPDFSRLDHVMNYLDDLHDAYATRHESLLNDMNSSLQASRSVASLIVQQALSSQSLDIAAA